MMTTDLITVLQPHLIKQFKQIIKKQQLGQGYLFVGEAGTGKHELASWLAQAIFCIEPIEKRPCGVCEACIRVAEGNHPDVLVLKPEGQSIKIDDVRYLKTEFTKSGLEGNKRVFIIEDGEKMTTSAANGLLKFIEEPLAEVYMFITTTQGQQILPTIRSRMQLIQFPNPSKANLIQQLQKEGITLEKASILAHLTNNLLAGKALAENSQFEQVTTAFWQWFNSLQTGDEGFIIAGVELTPLLKNKLDQRQFLDLVVLVYQDLLILKYQTKQALIFTNHEPQLKSLAEMLSASTLMQQLDAVLLAQTELTQNVSFQTVIESLSLKLT